MSTAEDRPEDGQELASLTIHESQILAAMIQATGKGRASASEMPESLRHYCMSITPQGIWIVGTNRYSIAGASMMPASSPDGSYCLQGQMDAPALMGLSRLIAKHAKSRKEPLGPKGLRLVWDEESSSIIALVDIAGRQMAEALPICWRPWPGPMSLHLYLDDDCYLPAWELMEDLDPGAFALGQSSLVNASHAAAMLEAAHIIRMLTAQDAKAATLGPQARHNVNVETAWMTRKRSALSGGGKEKPTTVLRIAVDCEPWSIPVSFRATLPSPGQPKPGARPQRIAANEVGWRLR